MRRNIRKLVIKIVAFASILVLATPLLKMGYRELLHVAYPVAYSEEINTYAERFDFSPSLIYAIIHTESRFDPEAQSRAGAKGLMQLVDGTFQWTLSKLGEKEGDVFDPETNIRCGTKLLSYLCEQFEVTETALAAYNAGIGNVREWLKDSRYSDDGKTLHTIPFPETATYVKRVLATQKMYQTLYELP